MISKEEALQTLNDIVAGAYGDLNLGLGESLGHSLGDALDDLKEYIQGTSDVEEAPPTSFTNEVKTYAQEIEEWIANGVCTDWCSAKVNPTVPGTYLRLGSTGLAIHARFDGEVWRRLENGGVLVRTPWRLS